MESPRIQEYHIGEVLAALRGARPQEEFHPLVLGLRAVMNIEPFIWLCDVAQLSRYGAIASARVLRIRIMSELV